MKRILIFSLNYYPHFIGGAEVAIKEITDRISPEDIEFHMVTLRMDATLPKEECIGNVTVHRIGPSVTSPTISDLGKFPLHYAKHLYQLLAVFLTYTAIVSAYVPLFAMELQRLNALRTETKAAENAQPKPATAIATPAATPAPLAEGAAIDENVADEEPLSFGGFVVAMVMLVGFIYIIPFYDSLIGLAIIAFGLYKAWELNKRMQSTITGPFPVPVPHAPEEATASA